MTAPPARLALVVSNLGLHRPMQVSLQCLVRGRLLLCLGDPLHWLCSRGAFWIPGYRRGPYHRCHQGQSQAHQQV